MAKMTVHAFPPGARVLLDGRDEVIVVQAFPEGSTSLLSPHYVVRPTDSAPGHDYFKAPWKRVSVERVR